MNPFISKYSVETKKNALLSKIERLARDCDDIKFVTEQRASSPRNTEVDKIWKIRYEELRIAELEIKIPTMSFLEVLQCHNNCSGYPKISQLTMSRLLSMYRCYTPVDAYECSRINSDAIMVDRDISNYFYELTKKMAEDEASQYMVLAEAEIAYTEYKENHGGWNNLPSSINDAWRKRLEFLNEQETEASVHLCNSVDDALAGFRACWSDKARELWYGRLLILCNEEARRNAPNCSEFEEALENYKHADKDSLSRQIWLDRASELAPTKALNITDIDEAKSFCEMLPQDSLVQTHFLLQYMELVLAS